MTISNPLFHASNAKAKLRKFYFILVLAGLLIITIQLSGHAFGFEKPYQINHIYLDLCSPYDGMILCGRKIEKQSLLSSKRAILRIDDSLCLPLLESDPLCFKNNKKRNNDFAGHSYAFAGSFVNSYYLVLEILDEDWNLLLISMADGHEVRLLGYPILNPSNTAFAIASFDIDAGYRPNIVQIWSIPIRKRPVIEINEFPDNQGPLGITWLSDTKLQVTLANLEGASGDQMILQAMSSVWSVDTIKRGRKEGNGNPLIQ